MPVAASVWIIGLRRVVQGDLEQTILLAGIGGLASQRLLVLNLDRLHCIQAGMLNLAMQPETTPVAEARTSIDVDDALVRAAAGGDVGAFESLYRQHLRRVHAVVWRLVGGNDARGSCARGRRWRGFALKARSVLGCIGSRSIPR
jgi:hypothetical protein